MSIIISSLEVFVKCAIDAAVCVTANLLVPDYRASFRHLWSSYMTNSFITLESVSFVLPDGTSLFSQLNESFDSRHTGLVGRNGVGKSVLSQILAGIIGIQ